MQVSPKSYGYWPKHDHSTSREDCAPAQERRHVPRLWYSFLRRSSSVQNAKNLDPLVVMIPPPQAQAQPLFECP